ncbi:MAG: tripartite tricarboxylate transporter substrate binding protein [Betaproteobacteria bacterium]|nr:tripartite tricarboxylate transporter substrate binding protein [Betaproteobacteria bacterium]
MLQDQAQAQTYPAKPVRIVNPNPPGGSIDIQARIYAQKLQEIWNQPVVVDYKTGGGTMVGMEHVAKSAPDGYTIGMAVTAMVILPALRSSMPYDTVKDLAGVMLTATSSIMIVGSPTLEANTLAELIALAKKRPGKLAYASPGPGGANHLAFELLKQSAGIEILHVAFKGGAQAYPEVMAGRIDLQVDPSFGVYRFVKAGKMKGIAVTSAKRDAASPEVPAIAETLPGFEVLSINGLILPRATPRDLVARLNTDFRRVLRDPDTVKRFAEMGLDILASTPDEFDTFVRTEIARWSRVAKEAGIKIE